MDISLHASLQFSWFLFVFQEYEYAIKFTWISSIYLNKKGEFPSVQQVKIMKNLHKS